ncbi:MarR family winged helix-turn-helix transcriptional regulator [Paenarthrobacter sp. NPDC090522]|uniref:MarR family winged helix-turn-helix transcriptional regulator n=1 Tax=Paenarthrobacter sp. NPDC090522 TaxID=3364383 RepID=UPI003812143F
MTVHAEQSEESLWPTSSLLSAAARLLGRRWNDELQGLGLSVASVTALDALAVKGTTTQAALARSIRIQPQSLGPTLHLLASMGHVSIIDSGHGRSRHEVTITGAGVALLEKARGIERALLSGLCADSLKFRDDLEGIVRGIGQPALPPGAAPQMKFWTLPEEQHRAQ